MILKRFATTTGIAFSILLITGFLSMQGMQIVNDGLFSTFGILFLGTIIFNELTALSL